MRVFLGWSGPTSRQVAELLRDWLPKVVQAVDPWMSEQDIEKGARWSKDIAEKLEEAKVGVICVTPANLGSRWLHFEAGALSKTVGDALVCPYLHGLVPADLDGPLAQFQAARSNPEETQDLVRTINAALGESALSEERLSEVLDARMPEFQKRIETITAPSAGETIETRTLRSERELLEEVVERLRDLERPVSLSGVPTIEQDACEEARRTLDTMRKVENLIGMRISGASKGES